MDSSRLEAQGPVHLDTVRALHQTVVSLRTALEVSKNELKELKDKYEKHSQCIEYTDIIEKLTLENHILRRKIIDSGYTYDDKSDDVKNIELEYPHCENVVIGTATTEASDVGELQDVVEETNDQLHESELIETEEVSDSEEDNKLDVSDKIPSVEPTDVSNEENIFKEEVESTHESFFKTKLELLSKFDVKIKVCTVNKDDAIASSTTSDTESTIDNTIQGKKTSDSRQSYYFDKHIEHFEETKDIKSNIELKAYSVEDIKMAVPIEAEVKGKNDNFNVQVRITSEDNIIVNELKEKPKRRDPVNLDVDNLSLR